MEPDVVIHKDFYSVDISDILDKVTPEVLGTFNAEFPNVDSASSLSTLLVGHVSRHIKNEPIIRILDRMRNSTNRVYDLFEPALSLLASKKETAVGFYKKIELSALIDADTDTVLFKIARLGDFFDGLITKNLKNIKRIIIYSGHDVIYDATNFKTKKYKIYETFKHYSGNIVTIREEQGILLSDHPLPLLSLMNEDLEIRVDFHEFHNEDLYFLYLLVDRTMIKDLILSPFELDTQKNKFVVFSNGISRNRFIGSDDVINENPKLQKFFEEAHQESNKRRIGFYDN